MSASIQELKSQIDDLRSKLSIARRFAERISDGWALLRDGTLTNNVKGEPVKKKHPDYSGCSTEEALILLRVLKRTNLETERERELLARIKVLEEDIQSGARDFRAACEKIGDLEQKLEKMK